MHCRMPESTGYMISHECLIKVTYGEERSNFSQIIFFR